MKYLELGVKIKKWRENLKHINKLAWPSRANCMSDLIFQKTTQCFLFNITF